MAEWQHLCESYGRYLSSAHAGRLYDMGIQALQFYNASAWEALWATPSPSWNWGPVPNIEPTSPTNGGVGGTRALAHSIKEKYSETLKSTNSMELCQVSLGRRWIRKSNMLTRNKANPNGTPMCDKLCFGKFCCVKMRKHIVDATTKTSSKWY